MFDVISMFSSMLEVIFYTVEAAVNKVDGIYY